MLIEYEINGIKLDAADLSQICEYYQAATTADTIAEAYDIDDKKAMRLGYEVRNLMNKYNIGEVQAIEEIMRKNGDVGE